jgi:hypothetical protein
MLRLAWLLIPLVACGGPPRVPSKLFANGGGECTEAAGCEAPIESQPRYELPDVDHPMPPDPNDPNGDPALVPAQPREATCADVALSAAALEVGNYADESTRAPALKKYKALCAQTKLDPEERRCVFESIDAKSMAYCAPRFMPQHEVKLVAVKDCAAIAHEIGVRMAAYSNNSDLFERQLAAVLQSCEKDRWTVDLAACARSMYSPAQVGASCALTAPPSLRTRVQDRLAQIN